MLAANLSRKVLCYEVRFNDSSAEVVMMRLRQFYFLLFVLLLSACAVNETARVDAIDGEKEKEILESDSGFLAASLKIIDTKTTKAGDLLRIQATLKNASRQTISFQYKVKWLDQDGFAVALGGRPWTPAVITPQEQLNVQAVAPNASVTSFTIQVQD
jgi:uncharacterized protein YcfL